MKKGDIYWKISTLAMTNVIIPVEIVNAGAVMISFKRRDRPDEEDGEVIRRKNEGQFFSTFDEARNAIIRKRNMRINLAKAEIIEHEKKIKEAQNMDEPKIINSLNNTGANHGK